MIVDPNVIKAIINFYLQSRIKDWGMKEDEFLALLVDKNSIQYKKTYTLYDLNSTISTTKDNQAEWLKFCDTLKIKEEFEASSHHSNRFLASPISDLPLMACTLRAIRSYIMDKLVGENYKDKSLESLTAEIAKLETKPAAEKTEDHEKALTAAKQNLETFKLINYYRYEAEKWGMLDFTKYFDKGFLNAIKYIDNKSTQKFQKIKSFDEFFRAYYPSEMQPDKVTLLIDKINTVLKATLPVQDSQKEAQAAPESKVEEKATLPVQDSQKEAQAAPESKVEEKPAPSSSKVEEKPVASAAASSSLTNLSLLGGYQATAKQTQTQSQTRAEKRKAAAAHKK